MKAYIEHMKVIKHQAEILRQDFWPFDNDQEVLRRELIDETYSIFGKYSLKGTPYENLMFLQLIAQTLILLLNRPLTEEEERRLKRLQMLCENCEKFINFQHLEQFISQIPHPN